jgi:hypothetical protein
MTFMHHLARLPQWARTGALALTVAAVVGNGAGPWAAG